MTLDDTSLVLVRPQMGENIGAAARVMKNFALSDLRIVAPRDGWPNDKAIAMAAHASDVIESAKVYDALQDAVADCQVVYATTARERAMQKPVHTARDAAQHIAHHESQKTAILFGPERTGLENEDIVCADHVITIPVNPNYPSLNLAQCVGVVVYEIYQAVGSGQQALEGQSAGERSERQDNILATKADMQHLFDHLEGELDARNFWNVDHKKDAMWQNIRSMFGRGKWSAQEVQTLRGMIRCLTRRES